MPKKRSVKFWIIFWTVSVLFLVSFYVVLEIRRGGLGSFSGAIDYLPMSAEKKDEAKFFAMLESYVMQKDDQEKTFLVLFQNDMELRPGGGYIGSFGILKMKNGEVEEIQTHDLSNFDARVPNGVEPPYPMKDTLRISSWKMRDSNWSPDFPTNVQKAEEFYYMGQGQEQFDGVIAINSDVLRSFLAVTGPVQVPGFPGTYDSENAALNLEYQVERAFIKQGLSLGERKSIMEPLAKAVIEKAKSLGASDKLKLAGAILDDLKNKNVQLYFKDQGLEYAAQKASWAGMVDASWNDDYLMMVDANLGSLKSDFYIKRAFDYTVDFSGDAPKASLKITYAHTAKEKDWMTKDYLAYLRVYVPNGSWLTGSQNLGELRYGSDFGKKYFGSLFEVKIGQSRTVELDYNLPSSINLDSYKLLIQRQSGVHDLVGKITLIDKNGARSEYNFDSIGDYKLEK